MFRSLRICCAALILIGGCSAHSSAQNAQPAAAVAAAPVPNAPPAPREFRGVWVASVNNANWPSKPGLTVDEQKKEMIDLLDRCAAARMNAVVFQVRPCGDALYKSELEPWSEYITGVQGQAPAPFYDPLQMWIEESHKRGLELHAWFNPYRAKHTSSKANIANSSIAKTHPEIVRSYGGYLWMDPGEPLSAQHTLNVILDIVKRYDVDGVHTDDYYYPYKVKGEDKKNVEFPDNTSYEKYRRTGGKLSRDDWRRNNVDQLIERLYTEVKKSKPWVKVSYGPFGIWKPNYPPGIEGLSQYDELYSDARLWLNKGWLDFVSPQLYWKIGGKQDFAALLSWWVSENKMRRYVWPGMSVGRHPPQEVLNQVELTRRKSQSTGQLFWSVNSILRRKDLLDALEAGPYAEPAVIPPMTWLDSAPPPGPIVSADRKPDGAAVVSIKPGAGEKPFVFAIYARYGAKWNFTTVPAGSDGITLNPNAGGEKVSAVVVSAIDRCGNESPRANLAIK